MTVQAAAALRVAWRCSAEAPEAVRTLRPRAGRRARARLEPAHPSSKLRILAAAGVGGRGPPACVLVR